EPVEERRSRLVPPVAVAVFEHLDGPSGLAAAVEALGIVAHLADPEPAVAAEINRDRAVHERLRGHELDLQTGLRAERPERLGGRTGRRHRVVAGTRLRRLEAIARRRVDGRDNESLDARLEPGRAAVVDHRAAPLVSPLAEDPLRRDIARGVV